MGGWALEIMNPLQQNSLLQSINLSPDQKTALNLPVEFCVLNKRVRVSISDEHLAPHTGKTFRVVLLLPGNLFAQGGAVMKHNATGMQLLRGDIWCGLEIRGLLFRMVSFCAFLRIMAL